MAIDEEECYSADFSILGTVVKSVCPVTTMLNSGSGITTMSESMAAKLQVAVPDVEIVRPITDSQKVEMADDKLVHK